MKNTLPTKEYLKKIDKKEYYKYDDVNKILPHSELKNYIKTFLIDNNDFLLDVDCCMWENSSSNKLINKTIKERIEYFDNTIGNESRTYILKILTLKHLSKILFKNINGFTDEYWRKRMNNVLQKEEKLEKINELAENKKLSISTLQRYFCISFPKATAIVEFMIENKIIEKLEVGYKIINKNEFVKILIEKLVINTLL